MPPSNPHNNYIHEQSSALTGLRTESIGKTQARQEFLPLVDELQKNPRTIEITDREQPVAVLLSYGHYAALVSQLAKLSKTIVKRKIDDISLGVIVHDLESGSKEIASEFELAIQRSVANL